MELPHLRSRLASFRQAGGSGSANTRERKELRRNKMSPYTNDTKPIRRIITARLSVVLGITLLGAGPCFSQPKKQLPASPPRFQHAPPPNYEDDTLLIMPAANADTDEV